MKPIQKITGIVALCGTVIFSTSSCSNPTEQKTEKVANDKVETEVLTKAKKIFYSLPSPLELSTLIQRAGGTFDESLLSNHKAAVTYEGSMKQALNLGVYGADLSYATVFRQNQRSLLYMAASKKLAEKLGVTEAFSEGMLERTNNNINNRDSMMAILTEVYWLSNSQLKEDNRDNLAALTMVGGWIEGLYLGTSMLDLNKPDSNVVKRLMEQKYTAGQLENMMSSKLEEPMVSEVYDMASPVFDFFKTLEIQKTNSSVSEDSTTGVTSIGGKRRIVYTQGDLQKLTELVASLRTQIIS